VGVDKSSKKFKKDKSKKQSIDIAKLIKKGNHKIDVSFLQSPLKSPACKSCPALKKGICKCARKKLK